MMHSDLPTLVQLEAHFRAFALLTGLQTRSVALGVLFEVSSRKVAPLSLRSETLTFFRTPRNI